MVDAKELRIGSHIEVNGEICEVIRVYNSGLIEYLASNGWFNIGCVKEWVKPIPITHELLQKIGFIQDYDCEDYIILSKVIKGHKTDIMFCNGNWYVTIFELGYLTKQKAQYLHELETYVYLTLHEELIKD